MLRKKTILFTGFGIILLSVILVLIYFLNNYFIKKNHPVYKKIAISKLNLLYNDHEALDFITPLKETCSVFNKQKLSSIITKFPVTTTIADWQTVCSTLENVKFSSNEDVFNFIKNNFDAFYEQGHPTTHITGYYRIILEGSLEKTDVFKYPIYKLPKDLITVKLNSFSDELPGKKIYGRVDQNNNLIPYYTRKEINQGVLENKGLEILWVNNKYSAFLLHVQGSGVVKVGERLVYLSYAGKNGHPFSGIYRYMKEKQYLKNYKIKNMDAVYDFFANNPDKIDQVLDNNPSYIFFKEVNKNNWYAAFGTNPYAERTVAVDKNFIALGVPLLINIKNYNNQQHNMVRLVVANDTGSAIKGPSRIDFYWGIGKTAGSKAEATNTTGDVYILLPKTQKTIK